MKKREFEKRYFTSGNFLTHKMSGVFTTYYWARRFYAKLVKQYVKSGKILEIGCSYGDLLSHFGKEYQVVGVEISKFACREAKKRHPNLEVKNEDALVFLKTVPDSSIDALIQVCVIPHMDDAGGTIKEIARVLKKGGIFFSVTPNPNYPLNKLKGEKSGMFIDKTHKHLYSNEKWIEMIEQEGLKVIKKGSNGWWDVPYIPLIPRFFQLIIFAWPAVLQILLNRIFLPAWMGVELLLIAKKN